MNKEIKFTKYLYKKLMYIECIHFIEAFEKKLLDISENDEFDNESFNPTDYSDILAAFESGDISEIPDSIKFFMKLKTKQRRFKATS